MTRIQDRTENKLVAETHPLAAAKVLELTTDKTHVFWISPFELLIVNNTEQWWRYSERAAARM